MYAHKIANMRERPLIETYPNRTLNVSIDFYLTFGAVKSLNLRNSVLVYFFHNSLYDIVLAL